MAPQAKKNLRYGSFYITYSLNETFFAEQKKKNGAAGKKKLRYRLDDAVSNPVPHGTPVVQPWDFFFFFFFFWRGDPKPGSPLFFFEKIFFG